MAELKKTTRFLLVSKRPARGHKSFFRRAGIRFDRERRLVDVEKIGEKRAKEILAEPVLDATQLTAKQAEKYERLLVEQKPQESQLDVALAAARSALAHEKQERAKSDANYQLLFDEHRALEAEHSELRAKYEALVDAGVDEDEEDDEDDEG